MPIPPEPESVHRYECCELRQGQIQNDGEIQVQVECGCTQKVYLAVGIDLRENMNNLMWTLATFKGLKIVLLHVHQPANMIPGPFGGGKVPSRNVTSIGLCYYRQLEWDEMMKNMNEYLKICRQEKADAEHLVLTSEDEIQNVIVESISQYRIQKLVMGAAADGKYSRVQRGAKLPTSKKAMHVNLNASPSCKIWFVCKGSHIYTREPSLPQARERSVSGETLNAQHPFSARPMTSLSGYRAHPNSPSSSVCFSPQRSLVREDLSRSSSGSSLGRIRSFTGEILEEPQPLEPATCFPQTVDLEPMPTTEASDDEDSMEMEELLGRFRRAMEESQTSKKQAILRAKLTKVYLEKEQEQRREAESVLLAKRVELERLMRREQELRRDLRNVSMQKSWLEAQNQELQERLESLQLQNDSAEKKIDEVPSENSLAGNGFTEFSHIELAEATNSFSNALQIREGAFGTVYGGRLGHESVAIDVMKREPAKEGYSEFHHQVQVLSKMRHPHLVKLIGMCTEPLALIYEHHCKVTLEDKLQCKRGTHPLTWQARTRVATEICSALLFLHSSGLIHGNLNASNTFLDANLVAKMGEYGIRPLLRCQTSEGGICIDSDKKENMAYIDPEFLTTGNLPVAEHDIYSFGIILLRLLTGNPASWVATEVQKMESPADVLASIDPRAGDWPFIKAIQLAKLGLNCCRTSRQDRPDLKGEVWRVMEPMRASLLPLPSRLAAGETEQPPTYFICPIFRELMKDPQVAADGYTYEADAIRGWINSGHDTSPMTNLKLSHQNLTPNHALRFVIQEWLDQQD